jgi:serine/threonine-protein kinase
MIPEVLAHYRILKKLGKGGMGEVYLAHDTNLERDVAIKILAPRLIADENAKRRLIREAKAAAKLDHPNICFVYEVREIDSLTFIVMKYLKGETLAERMKRKPLELGTALAIITQAARGLAEAHKHDIIHRDIKPQNIMITADEITADDQVKILDFGLAKQLRPTDEVDYDAPTENLLSKPGMTIGTLPYMSPEQLEGKQQIDACSDIFSLGITFFEMLAGKHPFKDEGDSDIMIGARILREDPKPIEQIQPLAPAGLRTILGKMLFKDKAARYQSVQGFLDDLKKLPTPVDTQPAPARTNDLSSVTPRDSVFSRILTAVRRNKWAVLASVLAVVLLAVGIKWWQSTERLNSLAILPFTYVSSDPQLMANPDREYLSDGFTDSVINSLSQLPDLRVIARSSVFRYKGKNLDVQAIGRKLNVRAVLVGQITQAGDELTINAELMNVADNRSIWGGTYQRKTADIQTVQNDIAKNISERLRLKLTGADQTHLAKTYTNNGEAYEAYLKGRYHWNKRTDEGFKTATKFFQEATDKDPSYALAYAGLADCYSLRSDYGFLAASEGYRLAKGWANLALKYDDSLAEAHTTLASIRATTDWDWQGAENEYRRAIELNPNYPTAHHWYAVQLLVQGRLDQALQEIKKAQQLDPLSLGINKDFAVILLYMRDYDKALEQCLKTLEIEPEFHAMSIYIAQVYELKQKYSEAVAELEKAHVAAPEEGEITYGLAQAYALNGRKDEALKVLNELKTIQDKYPAEAAYLYGLLGEKEKAIAALQTGCDNRYFTVAEIKADPRFDELRKDARIGELLQRIKLAG